MYTCFRLDLHLLVPRFDVRYKRLDLVISVFIIRVVLGFAGSSNTIDKYNTDKAILILPTSRIDIDLIPQSD